MKENRWLRKRLIRAGYLVLKQRERSYIAKLSEQSGTESFEMMHKLIEI